MTSVSSSLLVALEVPDYRGTRAPTICRFTTFLHPLSICPDTNKYTPISYQLESMNILVVSFFVLGIVLLLVILLSTVILFYLSSKNSVSAIVPLTSPVGLLYQCTDYTCQEGTTCDSSGLCKLDIGSKCQLASDCVEGSYCSGVCVSESRQPGVFTGDPGSPCPCGTGMVCNVTTCKRQSGFQCTLDSDCLSNDCSGGTCASGSSLGNVCVTNSDCISGNCSLGICQQAGIVTGQSGSVCSNSGCVQGLTCRNGTCS